MTDKVPEPVWKALHKKATIVDLHAHPILKALLFRRSLSRSVKVWELLVGEMNPLSVQTGFPKLQSGEVDVLFSTAYPLEKRIFDDIRILKVIPLRWIHRLPIPAIKGLWAEVVAPPYFTVANTMLDYMERQVEKYNRSRQPGQHPVQIAKSVKELDQLLAHSDHTIALVHSLEGGHSLEGKIGLKHLHKTWDQLTPNEQAELRIEVLQNLEALFNRGVAYLVIAHFYPNKLIMPVFPYPEHVALSSIPRKKLEKIWRDVDLTGGLTGLGQDVVKKMIELGMLIDLTHSTPKARQDVYDVVTASGSERPFVMATHVGAYEINPSPYNLKDWEIEWIAQHKGIIGVIFMTYWLMPEGSLFGINFISRTIEHIMKVGGEDVVGIGTDFDGADPPDDLVDESKMGYLTERLYSEYTATGERKYTDQQIEKILGGNALRVLREGWGKL